LLGFISGNEVAGVLEETKAMPYIKASIRDFKSYIRSLGKQIPVGYAATDAPPVRWQVQTFLDCGDDSERADFFGVNIYTWCSPSNYELAFEEVTKNFSTWDVPVLFTEYGCNYPKRERDFAEVPVIYGPEMMGVFSGGLVFEYSEEVNSFGLGNSYYDNKTFVPFKDYDNLKKQLATINPTGPKIDSFVSKGIKKSCPVPNGRNWLPMTSPLPRTPSDEKCNCIAKKFRCRTKETDPANITPLLGTEIGNAFNFICTNKPELCTEVENNPIDGVYGNYSACDPLITVSIVMNNYYNLYVTPESCSFNGIAEINEIEENDENCDAIGNVIYSNTNIYTNTNTNINTKISSSTQVVKESSRETITIENSDPNLTSEAEGLENSNTNDCTGFKFFGIMMIVLFFII